MLRRFVIPLLLLPMLSCRTDEKFPALADKVASPVDIAVNDSGEYFYLLNSDFDRTYNQGSLLVLDADGNKAKAVPLTRLGRNLTAAGNDLLITMDAQDDGKTGPQVLLYDISTPTSPELKATLPLTCSPANAVLRSNYNYFAVACFDGSIWIGTLASDRTASTLKKVRQWGGTRRALYLDTTRNLLLGFPSISGRPEIADREFIDITRYNSTAAEVKGDAGEQVANEIPDAMEQNKRAQSNRSQREAYQFFVYDIAKEKEQAPDCTTSDTETCAFPYRDKSSAIAEKELRWIYFKLDNFDGTPDQSDHFNDNQYKYYRTNFYEAKPDPEDTNSFYLSQRGVPNDSQYANQIIKVTYTGDLRPSETAPKTGDVLQFARVYGFKGAQASKNSYPGDFDILSINGQKTVVVNHFRDLITWSRNDTFYSVSAQLLDNPNWFSELTGQLSPKSDVRTYYQVAVNSKGRAMSPSFYGNSVVVFDINPGVNIEIKKILK